jgi:hypothetical protein
VSELCQRKHLSKTILTQLEQEEFQTTAALFEVSDAALTDAGFKGGHIAEIKRALKDFLSEDGLPDAASK